MHVAFFAFVQTFSYTTVKSTPYLKTTMNMFMKFHQRLCTDNKVDDHSIDMQDALVEIEALQAIFNDELIVDQLNISSESPSITVQRVVRPAEQAASDSPAVASLRSSASVLVFITVDAQYPASSPIVQIKQPRGLAEDDVRCLETQITSHLDSNSGMPVIFDIFQLAQTFLEQCDIPRVLCSICLTEFSSDTTAVSIECGHFFHRHCLGRYLRHCEEETNKLKAETPTHMLINLEDTTPKCPVCRAELSDLSRDEIAAVRTSEDDSANVQVDLQPWRAMQEQMKEVFERQREKGGLINLEEEKKRNLITEETRVVIPTAAMEADEVGPSTEAPSTSTNSEREKEPTNNNSKQHHRQWRGGRNAQHHQHHRPPHHHQHHHHKPKGADDAHNSLPSHSSHRRPHKPPRAEEDRGHKNENG